MGKKNKTSTAPNAPELQQILLEQTARQPPRNPYYPDLGDHTSPNVSAPPPYSDLSISGPAYPVVPASMANQGPPHVNYSRLPHQTQPTMHQQPQTVIIRQDYNIGKVQAALYTRRVRKYNNELLVASFLVIVLSIYANSLYDKRPCTDYLVAKPANDLYITVFTVRDYHMTVAAMSFLVLVVTILKCCCLGTSKNHSCYLFTAGLLTLVCTLATGYLAYLAFYSPCTLKLQELAANWMKTLVGKLVNEPLPRPDREIFGESNVIKFAEADKLGLTVFILDIFSFALYLGAFAGSLNLC